MSLSKFFPCFQFRLDDDITKLDYSNNILTEGFPHVWQYERTLEVLNVTSTRINYLPPQLFYCQGLKILLANNNNLECIPEAIGSLRQLHQLCISRNFISNVPDNIKSCKYLTHLDLSCNSLQKLPDAITCLISLQELILNETYLEFLPANFGRLVNLRIVELRSNNLISLPKSMQRLTNLQRLDIGCNELKNMPEVVGELKQLRELWFDFNQIQNLPLQFGKLRQLIHCEANGNSLRYLPSDIGNLLNVEVLSLSMNGLTALPLNIGMLASLVTLKCESNELNELPDCISKLENLEELVVSHNKLVCLPNTIGMLRKLRYLFADDNNLQKLPDDICSCSILSVISVSRNKLSALPDNIGHLKNLKVLNIVQNNIATLPVSVLSLVNLASLWISNNQSQPLIPLQYTEISEKTYLTCFMLPQFSPGQTPDTKNTSIPKDSKRIPQSEGLLNKTAVYGNSNRRICFAEETTILLTDTQTPQLLPTYCESDNYLVLQNLANSSTKMQIRHNENNEIESGNRGLVPVMNPQDILMRSPTPYPKELRLMAKTVQVNHNKSLNSFSNDNSISHNHISLLECKRIGQQDKTDCGLYNLKPNEEKNCHRNTEINHADSLRHKSQQKQSQSKEKELDCVNHTELVTNSQEIFFVDNSPKPPPYVIARCFTKKSVEDLTNYELARNQQQQQRYQYQKSDISRIDSKALWQETETAGLMNDLKSNNNINFECQSNLISEQESMDKINTYNTKRQQKEIIKTEITYPENNTLYSNDAPETSKRKNNKSRTKWLFGVHKNPRVIQINVEWEHGRDFEIDMLPNKEGIFVVSTVEKSYASQLIQQYDKILEVEGIDFTNIDINEARKILENTRPSLCIMLSRK